MVSKGRKRGSDPVPTGGMTDWSKLMCEMHGEAEGKTAGEIAQEIGLSESQTRAKLRVLVKAGKVKVGKRKAVYTNGSNGWVPVYDEVGKCM